MKCANSVSSWDMNTAHVFMSSVCCTRKLTGRDTAELFELAQDRDVWRELVVLAGTSGLTYSRLTEE